MIDNRCIVLAARPRGVPREADFRLERRTLPAPADGQILCRNLYVSLDAGFRNWMDADSGDDVLPAMPLDAPVMGLTLSRVLESRHPDYRPGDLLMARFAWEEHTLTDAGDFISRLPPEPELPLSYYLGVLGDTGLSAYFGLTDYGRIQPGETVLVSAAAGAVGSIAGQIARLLGARAVGICSGREKGERLVRELGFEAFVDRMAADVDRAIAEACPDGVDVYFDNVGGPLLETVLEHISEDARILLCGAVATYNATEPVPGPRNLFRLVTRHAHMHGFMTHLQLPRYDEARAVLTRWINEGKIVVPEYRLEGIGSVPRAFCDLFRGANFGKTVVALTEVDR
ncbi:MAG: NADP-dependent oxidoreductase [Pseudomonadales bacterium]